MISATTACADGLTKRGFPSVQDIEPRLVCCQAVHDVTFIGNGPNTRGASARRFMEDIVRHKFGGSKGNDLARYGLRLGLRMVAQSG